jgi:hypothetical protein
MKLHDKQHTLTELPSYTTSTNIALTTFAPTVQHTESRYLGGEHRRSTGVEREVLILIPVASDSEF